MLNIIRLHRIEFTSQNKIVCLQIPNNNQGTYFNSEINISPKLCSIVNTFCIRLNLQINPLYEQIFHNMPKSQKWVQLSSITLKIQLEFVHQGHKELNFN